jgi:hypothetical protein
MNKFRVMTVLASTLLVLAGCGSDHNATSDPGEAPPAADIYTVAITEIEIVNKDSGAAVMVEGLPAAGGTLERN